MTSERIAKLRALVGEPSLIHAGLQEALDEIKRLHAHLSALDGMRDDTHATALEKAEGAIERVRALQKTHLRRELGGQWHAVVDPPRLHGTEFISFLDVLAALEGKTE